MRVPISSTTLPGVQTPMRVLVLVVMLAVGLTAALYVWRGSLPRRTPQGAAVPADGAGSAIPGRAVDAASDSGEDVVARALRLAAIDTTKKKVWVDDIPDLQLASLSAPARETFLRIANGRRCTCGCGFTLAGCRRFDSECEVSGPRAKALFDSVGSGRITSAQGFPARPGAR